MTYCGVDCCRECGRLSACGGCEACKGHPFGGSCIAERNKDFPALKQALLAEINGLGIDGLKVSDLYLLSGSYVNLEYPLPGGETAKFLKNENVYLGNQVECPGRNRCYGVVADENGILVSEYGAMGADPEIVLYRRRKA